MAKETKCTDGHCPIHGSLKTRGRSFVGTIVESRMQKTATVEWQRTRAIPKYERTATERTRVKAHNPGCISAAKGAIVRIKECRPLSKTKNFVITELLGENTMYLARKDLLEQARMPDREEEK